MIITCPRCSAQYSMDPARLPSPGTRFRCSNCSQTWSFGNPPPPPPAAAKAPPPESTRPAPAPPPEPVPPEPSTRGTPAAELPTEEPAAVPAPGTEPPGERPERQPPERPAAPATEAGDPPRPEAGNPSLSGEDTDGPDDVAAYPFGPRPLPPEPEAPPPPPGADEAPAGRPPFEAARRDRRFGAWTAAAVVAGLLVIAVSGLLVARQQVVALVPEAAALYAALGLDAGTPGDGLAIPEADVTSTVEETDGRYDLVIAGIVRNISAETRPVPAIRWSLLDAEGNAVQSIVVPPPRPELGPGEEMDITARIENRSPEGRQIVARWVSAE